MKRKGIIAGSAIIAILLVPTPSYALFGEDIIYLLQLVRQGAQAYQKALAIEQNIRQEAAFIKTPGAWKQIVYRAAGTAGSLLGKSSTGRDLQALAQLTEGRQGALEAIRQIANDPAYQPTAENSAAISNLHMKAVEATVQMNQLKAELDFKDKVSQYKAADPGMADSLDQIDNWHVKQ